MMLTFPKRPRRDQTIAAEVPPERQVHCRDAGGERPPVR